MTTISSIEFMEQVNGVLKQAIKHNKTVHINTDEGNAVLLSEDDYNELLETLYLYNIPIIRESVDERLSVPLKYISNEFVSK